jgi:hypothetical protein
LKSFKRLILATVSLLTFAAPASSNSVVVLASTPRADQGSIIYRGAPLDCAVDACPKAEPVVEAAAPTSGALVDAFGMPTKMPNILRGGQSNDDTVIMAPKETAPAPAAVTPAAAAAPSAPAAPPQAGQLPAEPAVSAPVAEAPAKRQPSSEGPAQQLE